MTWIVLTILLLTGAVACIVAGRRLRPKATGVTMNEPQTPEFTGDDATDRAATRRYRNDMEDYRAHVADRTTGDPRTSFWFRVGGFACLGLWLLLTVFVFSLQTVSSGEVGVLRTFGKINGQVGSGVNFILPWQTMETQNVRTQHYVFSNTEGDRKDQLTAASKDTQDVYIDATLNYSLSASKVQELLTTVGSNWFQVLVYPRVINDIKEQTVKYEATSILVNRETIRQATKDALAAELQPYSITVSDFLINNVDFNPDFKQAVEQKQAAAQNALKAANDADAAKATAVGAANAVREQAAGDADAIKARADAQAAANTELVQSLGSVEAYIEYQKALALQGWKPSVIGDSGVIVNAGTPQG